MARHRARRAARQPTVAAAGRRLRARSRSRRRAASRDAARRRRSCPRAGQSNDAELRTSRRRRRRPGTSASSRPSTQFIGLEQGSTATTRWVADQLDSAEADRHDARSTACTWHVYDQRAADRTPATRLRARRRPSATAPSCCLGTATTPSSDGWPPPSLADAARTHSERRPCRDHRHDPAEAWSATGARQRALRRRRAAASAAGRRAPRRASPRARRPVAALFGCSDSRLAAEIIFDKGLGDLFVIRNAGQVISDSVIGSLEYAVAVLHVPLIIVLGHDSCGAVARRHRLRRPPMPPPLPPHIAAPDRADRPPRSAGSRATARRRPAASTRPRSAASTCATPSPSCSSAPSSSAPRSPPVRWPSSARTTGWRRAGSIPTSWSAHRVD